MDELIDRALKSYAAREPGASLETRILAHAREQHRSRPGWLIAAAIITVAGVCVFLLPHRRASRSIAQALPPVHLTEAPPYAAPQPIPPAPRHRHHRTPEPKLAVFPSPAPIPQAEIALAHALSGDPQLAASLLAAPPAAVPAPITIEPLSIQALDED